MSLHQLELHAFVVEVHVGVDKGDGVEVGGARFRRAQRHEDQQGKRGKGGKKGTHA